MDTLDDARCAKGWWKGIEHNKALANAFSLCPEVFAVINFNGSIVTDSHCSFVNKESIGTSSFILASERVAYI